MITPKRLFFLLFGPVSFAVVVFLPLDIDPKIKSVLATTVWMAVWWISEAISISATALLPMVLFPVLGVTSISTVTTTYFSPIVVLYMGGFILALAIEKWGLHKRIALSIIGLVGTDGKRLILGFMLATFFLSMWISNTATTLMILPIALSIIATIKANASGSELFNKSLMLSLAYAASIGGLATVIGTPTNLIFTGIIDQQYGMEISFARWMAFGLPVSLLLLIVAWWYLSRRVETSGNNGLSDDTIKAEYKKLGKVSKQEKTVIVIFWVTAFAWISRTYLINPILPGVDDTVIAIFSALLLFTIHLEGKPLIDWKDTNQLPWGILIVFGGGLALAKGIETSGLALWLGQYFDALNGLPFIIILFLVVLAVNFFTEITSNVATASVLMPILATLSTSLGVHPFGLMMGASMAASCAFMLPVATPPNAIVFGSGHLEMRDMVRTGIWLNVATSIIVTVTVYLILPVVWEFDLFSFIK